MVAANSIEEALPPVKHDRGELQAAWISTIEDFQALHLEWNELLERSGKENVFLAFEWIFTWWKHWGAGRKLAIIAVRDRMRRLVALAPFSIDRLFGKVGPRRLSFLADKHVGSDHLSIVIEPGWEKEVIDAIVRTLKQHGGWDYIHLADLEDGPALELLLDRLEKSGMTSEKSRASVCHHIPLAGGFDEYLSQVGANLRYNFRRRSRALERAGKFEFKCVVNPEEQARCFPELLRLHKMRFEGRLDSALLKPGVPEFHAEALAALASRGLTRLFLLQVDSEPVAALYGFLVGRQFQYYQSGMHPAWSKHSVGLVMMGKVIDYAISAGCKDFDFLRGDESYKTDWARHSRWMAEVFVFDRRAGSRLARVCLRSRAKAGRLVRSAKRLTRRRAETHE